MQIAATLRMTLWISYVGHFPDIRDLSAKVAKLFIEFQKYPCSITAHFLSQGKIHKIYIIHSQNVGLFDVRMAQTPTACCRFKTFRNIRAQRLMPGRSRFNCRAFLCPHKLARGSQRDSRSWGIPP